MKKKMFDLKWPTYSFMTISVDIDTQISVFELHLISTLFSSIDVWNNDKKLKL